MDSNIEPKKLYESLIFTEAEECGKVMRVIFMRVDGRELAITEDIAINPTRDIWKLGNPETKSEDGETKCAWSTNRSIASSKVGPQ